MMKKGQNYDSFEDRCLDYIQRKLLLLKKKAHEKSYRELITDANTLTQAKKRIKDPIEKKMSEALFFGKLIPFGYYPHAIRATFPTFKNLTKATDQKPESGRYPDKILEKLFDYNFTDEPEPIRNQLIEEHNEFVSDVFSEQTIRDMLDVIFTFNHKSTEYTLDDNEKEYFITISKLLAIRALQELNKYLPEEYSKFLSDDLEKTIEICNMVGSIKN